MTAHLSYGGCACTASDNDDKKLSRSVERAASAAATVLKKKIPKIKMHRRHRALTKDTGKVASYDYKTRSANTIPSLPLQHKAHLEVHRDALGVQNFLYEQLSTNDQSKAAVVVAGNSGLPGGAVGLHTNVIKDVVTRAQLLVSPVSNRSTYGTQEEDVVKNWLLSECDLNGAPILSSMNLIFGEYGMLDYTDTSPRTKQGVNFTNVSKLQPSFAKFKLIPELIDSLNK